jgi:CheY-like chemotaxis protein
MTAPHTILVVEDDADIRDAIVELLADHGYVAVGAANGAEALDVLATLDAQPCLILLDLMMPVMDGEAFRQAQLENPTWAKIPVILMSAYRDVAQRADQLAVDYLAKPLGMPALVDATRKYCTGEPHP